jgi:pyrroline-5-carboxylate reductase
MSKITIIGGGSIGASLAKGLIDSGNYKPDQITVTKRQVTSLSHLMKKGIKVTNDNIGAIKNAEIVILAVLPMQLNSVLDEIKDSLIPSQIVISVISGVKIADIAKKIPNVKITRAMPNTAIAIRESMTCVCVNEGSKEHLQLTKDIFSCVGEVIQINEELMTSATALCACGVAFFLRAIRASSQGGVQAGFHAADAIRMAAQTAKGAASLLIENNSHPEDEIDKVTSPEGCTIEGLNEMEHQGFSSAMIKGIVTAAEKAGNLYKN